MCLISNMRWRCWHWTHVAVCLWSLRGLRTLRRVHICIHLLLLYTLPVKLLTRVILFQLTTEILRVALTETAAAAAGIVRINTDAIIVIIVIITVINRRPSFLQLVITLLVITVPRHNDMYYTSIYNMQR